MPLLLNSVNGYFDSPYLRCNSLNRPHGGRLEEQNCDAALGVTKMILLRPENLFSTIHHGTIKIRFRLAAGTTLVVLLAALLFTGAGEIAAAQDIFRRIAGTITDVSGAVVPNAKVTILNEATQSAPLLNATKDG